MASADSGPNQARLPAATTPPKVRTSTSSPLSWAFALCRPSQSEQPPQLDTEG